MSFNKICYLENVSPDSIIAKSTLNIYYFPLSSHTSDPQFRTIMKPAYYGVNCNGNKADCHMTDLILLSFFVGNS